MVKLLPVFWTMPLVSTRSRPFSFVISISPLTPSTKPFMVVPVPVVLFNFIIPFSLFILPVSLTSNSPFLFVTVKAPVVFFNVPFIIVPPKPSFVVVKLPPAFWTIPSITMDEPVFVIEEFPYVSIVAIVSPVSESFSLTFTPFLPEIFNSETLSPSIKPRPDFLFLT